MERLERLIVICLCAVGFVLASFQNGECKAYNAKVPNNGQTINNVIEVSPMLPSPYNLISTAIAQIPTSGPDAPSSSNPILIRVYPGVYNDHFNVPSYVKVRGMGEDPLVAAGVVQVHYSTSLPVVTMQPYSTLEGMTIEWLPGDPTAGTTSFSLLEILTPPGLAEAEIFRTLLTAASGSPSGLEGIRVRGGFVARETTITNVSTGMVCDNGCFMRDMIISAQDTGVNCSGNVEIIDSELAGSITGGLICGGGYSLEVRNSSFGGGGTISLGGSGSGTIFNGRLDFQLNVGSSGNIHVNGTKLNSGIANNGTGYVVVGGSEVDGSMSNSGGGTLKVIYCWDNLGNPVSFP